MERGGGRRDTHPPDSTVSLKPGLCAGGGRRCQRPSSKELRVIESEEVQCCCGKAKRAGAFLWIPCVRGASEVGSSVAAGRGGGISLCTDRWVGEVRVPTDDQVFIEFHSDGHKTANPIVQPAEKTTQTPAASGIRHGDGGRGSLPAGVC